MATSPAAAAAPGLVFAHEPLSFDARITDFDDVAERRERLLAYVEATGTVIVYGFILPDGAKVTGLAAGGAPRDARDQLQLVVGLVGGGVTRGAGGLAARIPKLHAARFETLARPLIEDFLVSLDLGE